MNRFLPCFLFALLAGCGSIVEMKQVESMLGGGEAVKCSRTEQRGCIEIDLLIVRYDDSVPPISRLVSGNSDGIDEAMEIYSMVKKNEVKLYESCVPVIIYFWNVNTNVPQSKMAEYDSSIRPSPVKLAFNVPIPDSELGNPDEIFKVTVCGGMGALQIPWNYITERTYTLICPLEDATMYPNRRAGLTKGLHLTTVWWKYASNGWRFDSEATHEFVLIPIVM